ncbi:ubiquitin carboxyl-terminal hydrolase 8 [Zygosaccharomyces mellis]|uniref:Ubiquitin carboxyl-terminal hydrolase n=1 Tax=Zygosaccharomyces mellis TaxID=42258 RepID=A0A4C2E1N6_9SACH|nr:ubiquitin carboxyl-terminal hydrolase 8 [Zygosaccharomyces mellis]
MLGCQHIDQVFQNEKSKDGVIRTCNAARFMISHFTKKEKYTYVMKCSDCHEINAGSNFMCLQCGFCGCWNSNHFGQHSKKVGHVFGINSSNGLLFCFKCGDYIGSNELIAASMLNKYWDDVATKTQIPKLERRDGLQGLLNMGSTCFMSSIVQCLIHNPYFFQFSINQLHYQRCTLQDPSSCISCALDRMVWEFYGRPELIKNGESDNNGNNIRSRDEYSGFIGLLVSSWKINENLAGYFQQDAHEYWQFLLNQLHGDHMVTHNKSPDETNFVELCDCIAHSTFQGSLKSSIVCPECQMDSKTTTDPFMDLSLDIKDKSNLYECLDSFHKMEQLHDFNYHCNRCNTAQNAIKRLIIHKLPAVLVLQLKRFEHHLNGNNVKLNDIVEFPLYLNMRNYCDGDDVPDIVFELIGIIAHRGTVNEGHYIAFTKVTTGHWFKFNDSMVSSITEEELLQEQAYLLFYVVNQVN